MKQSQTEMETEAGTKLPLISLQGKPYLQVAHRLVWFREEHPNWCIKTEIKGWQFYKDEKNDPYAVFQATIITDTGLILATATGQESKLDFKDFIEKAETKAIGRALAMCGYGTQFAPELDEGDRLADSPIVPAKKPVNIVKHNVIEIFALASQKGIADTKEQVLPAINLAMNKEIQDISKISYEESEEIITFLKTLK